MTSKILNDLIHDVNHKNIVRFFQDRTSLFQPKQEPLTAYEQDQFSQGIKLGEIPFGLIDHLIVCAFNVTHDLSERSGKKAQYDLAKKVIQDRGVDAGIFVFIGDNGAFRFSLVYQTYLGTKAKSSDFRRFTYFVSPQLTNKTFIQRIGQGDFSSLESIKDAFSVEKVTKEFYQKILHWYLWSCQQCQFPKGAEAEENGRQVAVIRLITRMIFIWFMREMKLVPNHLFDDQFVKKTLKEVDPDNTTYYLAILQNLFFATLNTKIEDRTFRSQVRGSKGYNPDFGNQYKFRYQDLFHDPDQLNEYFGEIPFLNGGLFDCLDDKEHGRYVDGFTETKKHQPRVPNTLFFAPEKAVDINAELGTSNRTYRVEGLINILSTYNFTIDENTLDDQDVALDPELLGKVFENLLASFNPETATTARKATGSYYTPREIVDYMVEEALKGYFQTHLDDVDDLEEKLNDLFAQNTEGHRFTDEETRRMVALVENVRIVDPAVGSGAFPMGALNKLVFILSKLDKDNALWKKAQLDAANAISDPAIRAKVKASIETYFREKDANYGRKLYLIQKCIYGVDIQQIAVEIAKLRFFISLLVNETINKSKDNWGIEPLPNLDFKIMQGNSLISEYLGINFSIGGNAPQTNGTLPLFEDDNKRLIEDFDQKKIAYQTASDPEKKKALQREIEDLLVKIFEDLVRKQKAEYFQRLGAVERKYAAVPDKETRENVVETEKRQLAKNFDFDFDQVERELRQFTSRQRIKPFFPWELYFSEVFLEKGGFDIVIANPPYLESRHPSFTDEQKNAYQNEINLKWHDKAKLVSRGADLLIYFYLISLCYLNGNGFLVFITQNAWLSTEYGKKFQKFLLETTNVRKILDSEFRYFPSGDGPNINTVITVFFGKKPNKSNYLYFIRLKESLGKIDPKQLSSEISINNELLALSRYKYTDSRLRNFKWGVLLESYEEFLDLIKRMEEKFLPIHKIEDTDLTIGQGLNKTKKYYVNEQIITKFNIPLNALIPILSSQDGALFNIKNTKQYLIDKNKIKKNEREKLSYEGIELFSTKSTRKIPPILIMPRGIGRHFCAYNNLQCYSSSGVEIYDNLGTLSMEKCLNLWLFFNSSVAWLIRETLGRKNLGGGMLKAEAVDLKGLHVYYDYKRDNKIQFIFELLKNREALSSVKEIYTNEHKMIDDIVFDALGIEGSHRVNYVELLKHVILNRANKATT
jgi:adenine-specific DNA-methyltransferase